MPTSEDVAELERLQIAVGVLYHLVDMSSEAFEGLIVVLRHFVDDFAQLLGIWCT